MGHEKSGRTRLTLLVCSTLVLPTYIVSVEGSESIDQNLVAAVQVAEKTIQSGFRGGLHLQLRMPSATRSSALPFDDQL